MKDTPRQDDAWSRADVKSPEMEPALLARWHDACDKIAHYAREFGWSKSEVARRAGIATGTFSQWYSGSYQGRYDTTTQKVENFLASVEEGMELDANLLVEPEFFETRLSRELFAAFVYAQKLPTIAIATVVAGMGKTMAAERFQSTRPHVFHITLSPSSSSPYLLKMEIAEQLGIQTRDAAMLKSAITNALHRDGHSALMILDEAQNLTEEGINELRYFRDMANCGLVLLGNDEVSTPYASSDTRNSSPQVARRIGVRMSVLKPYAEDIAAFIDAWGLEGDDLRETATKIASRAGALGALGETIKAASIIAGGKSLTADDLRCAYQLRGQGAI